MQLVLIVVVILIVPYCSFYLNIKHLKFIPIKYLFYDKIAFIINSEKLFNFQN